MKAFGVLAVLAASLLFTPALGADVESGPKAGEKVPELKAFGVTGTVEGKEADFVADRKDAPTIYLFVKAEEGGLPVGGRPLGRFMKVLDTEVAKLEGVVVVAVWLGDKAFDKHKEYLPKFHKAFSLEKTSLAAFDGERTGPNNWGVNADAHLTVVVVNKGKVVKSFAYESVNEKDVKPVVEELKKATDKK